MNGWIKLHRSLIEWEWYDDINVKVTFIHLLLSANHSDKKWRGIDIGRGQLWTSIGNLSKEVGLSEKQIRNCLRKLQSTDEIGVKGASKGTMITICKYDSYQSFEKEEGEQMDKRGASKGQEKGEQRATNNNDNNYKNEEERKEVIPSLEDFIAHAKARKPKVKTEAVRMKYYEWLDNGWNTLGDKSRPIKNWKSTLTNSLKYMEEIREHRVAL